MFRIDQYQLQFLAYSLFSRRRRSRGYQLLSDSFSANRLNLEAQCKCKAATHAPSSNPQHNRSLAGMLPGKLQALSWVKRSKSYPVNLPLITV